MIPLEEDTSIRILDVRRKLNYFDTQQIDLPKEISPLDAWNKIMATPQPLLKIAFVIRDAVSSLLGVKRIGGFSGRHAEAVNVGDKLDFFLVEHADPTCLVLTDRDCHLDVMTCISTKGRAAKITSSVLVHNLFGHFYMIPVGIAHRWIVHGMLQRLSKELTD